ncbi:protein Diedel-like [Drosophila ficusphila]|uniref:protein Diedel-like n=1 Tax=Drosophila ficusphila TaxID=30025 RepID=UPI001C8ACDB5|nr:protein Diedel-like [Drosophila ficusphila]
MRVVPVSSALLAILFLAHFGGSNAECCTTMAKLEFIINDGSCGQVNAERTAHGCTITVCGNGEALVGSFCGRGPCNIFGCDCEGGCLHGRYGESFLQRNRRHNIQLMRTQMISSSSVNAVTGIFSKFFK